MDPLDELYQTIILEHSRHPRNFGKIEGVNCCEGYNPLCGDRIGACVKIADGAMVQLNCFGAGCAISKASASLMTDLLKGQPVARFAELFELLQKALLGDSAALTELEKLGDVAALAGVRKFPARVKCATLGWQALKEALAGGTSLSVNE